MQLEYSKQTLQTAIDNAISQRPNETESSFHSRKIVFLKIHKKTNNIDTAIKFSNIWSNNQFMKCSYSEELMNELKQYLK